MEYTFYICRFVQFTAAMAVFGSTAFRFYAFNDKTASAILFEAFVSGCGGWRSRPRFSL